MTDTLFLLSTTYEKNKYGVPVPTNVKHETFCERKSISRSEFFNAGRNGLNPEYVFSVFKGDYEGESICEYNGETYAIYRTYETDDDYIELYVARKGGTNGEESDG
jgi:SPP1 family predicted phage head-tail adaptor